MTTAASGIGEPYKQLEQSWANFIGTKYAVACSSGTAGLHLALKALGVGPGDEVIVPEFTMIATAWAVTYCGATPVFVDCRDDLNVWAEDIDKKITPKTKAIMITHIYGRPVRDSLIMSRWGIPVIEDACEAHGAHIPLTGQQMGRKVGNFGTISVFSLYWNKIIQSEEGGLINTNYADLAEKMQDLKSMAFGTTHDYMHYEVGFNYRMTNMQAELALRELNAIDVQLSERKVWAEYLDEGLKRFTLPRPRGSVIWVYDMVFENNAQRNRVLEACRENGIEARHFFKPMSMQPMYSGYLDPIGPRPYEKLKAYDYSQRGMYLCFTRNWKHADIDKTIKIIKENL